MPGHPLDHALAATLALHAKLARFGVVVVDVECDGLGAPQATRVEKRQERGVAGPGGLVMAGQSTARQARPQTSLQASIRGP
jgi:hypothetical protein